MGSEPLLRNIASPTRGATGYLERSYKDENLRADNTLGALVVVDEAQFPEVQFRIGSGFGEMERQELWRDSQRNIGRIVKYKYMPEGTMDKPRHPIFLGFRED